MSLVCLIAGLVANPKPNPLRRQGISFALAQSAGLRGGTIGMRVTGGADSLDCLFGADHRVGALEVGDRWQVGWNGALFMLRHGANCPR